MYIIFTDLLDRRHGDVSNYRWLQELNTKECPQLGGRAEGGYRFFLAASHLIPSITHTNDV